MLLSLLTLGVLLAAKPPSSEKVFVPCPQATPEWEAARTRLQALDARLTALPLDSGRQGLAALREVLTSRCFEMSREEEFAPPDDVPAPSLKAWWGQGGRTWVESYLELGKPEVRTVVLPARVRPVLTREDAPPNHRLASLLCSSADATCGQETGAWLARADEVFTRESLRQSAEAKAGSGTDCEKAARSKPKRWRYTTWRRCRGSYSSFDKVLPVARVRTPTEGWLVLRGRRGHHAFCDEVRAYHLGTGAAWVSQSCSALALYEDAERIGEVDVQATDASRSGRVTTGTVSIEKLRELTWMLLLSEEATTVERANPLTLKVPVGYAIEWRESHSDDGVVEGSLGGGSMWGNSGQTRLQWTWFPPERGEPLSGELTWPESADPADDHADHLVVEAEATLATGCPPLPAPVDLLDFTRPGSVNRSDAPEGVAKPQEALVSALRAWSPPASCAGRGQ